ncbi:hypothetical protein DSO57_1001435, partial [Entomophthora muscae]
AGRPQAVMTRVQNLLQVLGFERDRNEITDNNKKLVDVVSKGEPCIDVEVEGHPTSIILDEGSTSNIISKSFIRSLEI